MVRSSFSVLAVLLLLATACGSVSAYRGRDYTARYQARSSAAVGTTADAPAAAARSTDAGRQSRFFNPFNIFTLVKIENFVCAASNGNNGTCYTASECTNLGGVASGTCAKGYGVCCVFTKTCGETTRLNNTYFVNENYPGSFDSTGSCQLTVQKLSNNICQLRLDFDSFVIAQPEPNNHLCQNDQFTVSGAAPVPTICGINTGNHMYVDAGTASADTPITLSFVTTGGSFSRSWKVRVSQIPCNTIYTAESSCLQYFTGIQGTIKSYNFDFQNGAQLSNQDYTSCVRMERNFCGIQYTPCGEPGTTREMSFKLNGAEGDSITAQAGAACDKDWLIIPCATDNVNQPLTEMSDGNVCVDRLCGDRFHTLAGTNTSDAVYSFMKPFRLYYHTDAQEGSSETPDSGNTGFCLNYVQQPCTA
ncbi:hypothetical protein FJT64_024384 [Amphibalanus amphitrite]|uniref:CUB domain-containing protein n=1 Tax=Amphibalanus amphitrite TaxID=1232801 RepID=A0A6A4WCE1_AMPAM|nr:hypothetical protein FJT64_024384 [Amphibalanus amphitrite]